MVYYCNSTFENLNSTLKKYLQIKYFNFLQMQQTKCEYVIVGANTFHFV